MPAPWVDMLSDAHDGVPCTVKLACCVSYPGSVVVTVTTLAAPCSNAACVLNPTENLTICVLDTELGPVCEACVSSAPETLTVGLQPAVTGSPYSSRHATANHAVRWLG